MGGIPFNFFKHMTNHLEFLGIVSRVWLTHRPKTLKQVWFVLREIKSDIKEFHYKEFKGVSTKIYLYREELEYY